MQIHEIFRKQLTEQPGPAVWKSNRTPTAPASSTPPVAATPSKLASLGNAVGSYLDKRAIDYASSKTGVNLSPFAKTQNPYEAPAAYDKAMAAVNGVYKQQAAVQKKLFDQAVAQAMGSQGVTKANQLSAQTQTALEQNLSQQLHKNLMQSLTKDYTKLPEMLDKDPATQAKANELVNSMTEALTQIKQLGAGEPQQVRAWEMLTKAAGEAMVLGQFKNPSVMRTAQVQTQSPAVAQAKQHLTTSSVTEPQLQAIQQLVGKLPAASSTDPRTAAYLRALGFNIE